jgi:SAM-dependent methyltransferase
LTVLFGDTARTESLTAWGLERGLPVDRWYIESFLNEHADLVRGQVLEVKEDAYATRFGASSVDVVDIDPSNKRATIVGDLCNPTTLQVARYDAAIVTQTLQFLTDVEAALRSLVRSLRAGGSLLISVPALSRLDGQDDRWRWTPTGLQQQLRSAVAERHADVEVAALGSGLSARAFLFGLAAEDLPDGALAVHDPEIPVVVVACVRLPC